MLAGSAPTVSADTFDNGAVAILAAVAVLMFGAAIALPLLHRYAQRAAASQAAWPQIRAVVESCSVARWDHPANATGRRWRCDVYVAYHYDGSRHAGVHDTFDEERHAREFAELYAPGSTLEVYVDPQRPNRAVMHPSGVRQDPAVLSGLVAMFVVVGGIAAVAAAVLGAR